MEFEKDLQLIKTEIKRFAIRHDMFKPENDKAELHLAHAISILDHVARKHKPKPKKIFQFR